MGEKRGKKFWKTKYTFSFLVIAMLCIFLFSLEGLLGFVLTNFSIKDSLGFTAQWFKGFMVFTMCILAVISVVLISMYIILYRSVGPLPRMEKTLEQVLGGNYAVRIKIRDKDAIHSLVDKMNQVLDLLEKAKKGQAA